MRPLWKAVLLLTLIFAVLVVTDIALTPDRAVQTTAEISVPRPPATLANYDQTIRPYALSHLDEGRRTFRYATFGDEAFWGDQLQLHKAIAGSAGGGIGPGLSPKGALGIGLKVDAEALPPDLVANLKAGKVNLDDPATTLSLLKLNAVVGVTGFFSGPGRLTSIGIQCALCHSTVDDSFGPGIGRRLDGWANRDLNVGGLIALAPNLKPFVDLLRVDLATLRVVLNSWGPGKFDALLVLDGKAFRPDGKTGAVLIPPAFGLAGVNLHTWTGFGSIPYWNAYVANLLMHGQGTFFDERLRDPARYPISARTGEWNTRNSPDLITPRMPALHAYQLDLPAPKPPAGSFNRIAALRGRSIFNGRGQCSRCHVPPIFVEPGYHMHTPAEAGIDPFQADRSPDRRYRTPPLAGLWSHQKGGFFHDGRFATLREVVDHYDRHLDLGLTEQQKRDLVEYLKSI